MKKSRNAAIDIIRICAATLIVLHHYQQGTGIEFHCILFYGGKFNFAYVVELFFVISGLLAYKGAAGLPSLREFGGVKCVASYLFLQLVLQRKLS